MKAYLEMEEIERLEQAASNLRDRLLIRLLARLGCRVSEALALTPNDIDFDNSTATILHLKARVKLNCPKCGTRLGKCHNFCPGCGTKVEKAAASAIEHRRLRTLPLDRNILCMMKDYIR